MELTLQQKRDLVNDHLIKKSTNIAKKDLISLFNFVLNEIVESVNLEEDVDKGFSLDNIYNKTVEHMNIGFGNIKFENPEFNLKNPKYDDSWYIKNKEKNTENLMSFFEKSVFYMKYSGDYKIQLKNNRMHSKVKSKLLEEKGLCYCLKEYGSIDNILKSIIRQKRDEIIKEEEERRRKDLFYKESTKRKILENERKKQLEREKQDKNLLIMVY